MSDGYEKPIVRHLKVAVLGTLYYCVFAGVYVSIIAQLPESFILHIDASTPPLAPEIVAPTLVLFGMAVLVAVEAHGKRGENSNATA